MSQRIQVEIHDDFQSIGAEAWQDLWSRSEVPSVFARHEWLTAWWGACADGRRLQLFTAHVGERLVAILPTIWPSEERLDSEPIVLVGHEHADYAAILVDRTCPEAFDLILGVLRAALPAHAAARIADVRSDSTHGRMLDDVAKGWASRWILYSSVPCPRASLGGHRLTQLVGKKSLLRHTKKLSKLGAVRVNHYQDAADILPRLDNLFAQHVERWSGTDTPSLFLREHNRDLYRALTVSLAPTGALLYTEITLDGLPAACHFGFLSEGDLVWYKPTFALDLARVSPGEVLLRELLLLAGERELHGVDFTRGNEAFKQRFADQERTARTYVLHGRRSKSMRLKSKDWVRRLLRGVIRRS